MRSGLILFSSILVLGTIGGFSNAYALSFEWDQDVYMIEHGGILTLIFDTPPGEQYDNGINVEIELDNVSGSQSINVTLTKDSSIQFSSQFVEFTNSPNGQNQLHVPVAADPTEIFSFTASIDDPTGISDLIGEVSQDSLADGRDLNPQYKAPKTKFTVVDVDCDNGFGGDTDGDGLCNDWEDPVNGLTVYTTSGGPTYHVPCTTTVYESGSLGIEVCPDPNKADLYYEIDYMLGHKPNETGLLQVINGFKWSNYQPPQGEKNVNLHIQLDEELTHLDKIKSPGTKTNPGTDQLKTYWYGTAEERGVSFPQAWNSDERDLKNQAFHYAIFGHDRFGHVGKSGYSEYTGNDVLVSLGSWDASVGSPDTQAGTLLHEIGHNLGLDHGGIDPVNCKPNYISVMSFTRQTSDFVDRDVKLSNRGLANLIENAEPENKMQVLGQYPNEPEVVYSDSNGNIYYANANGTEIDTHSPTELNYFPTVECNQDQLQVLESDRDSKTFEFLAWGHGNWIDGVSANRVDVSGDFDTGSTITRVQLESGAIEISPSIGSTTVSVSVPAGTSVPGCEETNECFIPAEVTVDVGGEVTWSNDDSAAHTVTGGSASDGPSGVFDSSLFMAGTTFSFVFEEAGTYDYFCMVHPWMEGIVTVQEAGPGNGNEGPGNSPTGRPLDECATPGSSEHGLPPDPKFDRVCIDEELTFNHSLESRKVVVTVLENTVKSIPNDDFKDSSQADSNKREYSEQLDKIRLHIGDQDMLSAIEETKTFQSWFDDEGEKEYIANKMTRDRIYNATSDVLEAQLTVVPEFEAVAIVILSISIIAVIALTSKTKLSLTRINQ